MTGQDKNERSRVSGWSPDAATRLKDAVKKTGSQADVAKAAGISRPSLVEILAGRAVPTNGTLANLCEVVGLSDLAILAGLDGDSGPNRSVAFIPVHDVQISAGTGVNAVEAGESFETLGFPRQWLRTKFGDPDRLRIAQIKGDSMAPTLNDGDLVMFNLDRRDPVDGIFVLRMDDQLLVKRVLFPSARRLLVTSDNQQYDRWDRMVDLERNNELQLLGRVVWTGKSV